VIRVKHAWWLERRPVTTTVRIGVNVVGGGTYARSIAVVLYTHPDRDNFDFRYTCPLVEFYNGDDDEYGKENVADGKSELTRRHIAAYTGAQMVNLAAISTNPCTLWPTVACTPA
jgi:hypothetical protein